MCGKLCQIFFGTEPVISRILSDKVVHSPPTSNSVKDDHEQRQRSLQGGPEILKKKSKKKKGVCCVRQKQLQKSVTKEFQNIVCMLWSSCIRDVRLRRTIYPFIKKTPSVLYIYSEVFTYLAPHQGKYQLALL